MKLSNTSLFIIPATIWGSTWFVIKFQLGAVDPLWSVGYRFMLAGLLLFIYCKISGINLSFPLIGHLRIALQGALLFGFNYWLVYIAEQELNSALMAVLFGFIMFLNILFSRLFMGTRATANVYLGGLLGLTGTYLIFYQQLQGLELEELPVYSTIIGFISVVIASLGNVTSAANQKSGIAVIPSNAFGMMYGALIMFGVAIFTGIKPAFDVSPSYIGSLIYLSLFGSVAAFGTYLTLIGRIGPGKAAYVLVLIPVIALILSTIFEGYAFSWYALLGVVLILSGNITIINRKAKIKKVV